jgi:hypothetical protein
MAGKLDVAAAGGAGSRGGRQRYLIGGTEKGRVGGALNILKSSHEA